MKREYILGMTSLKYWLELSSEADTQRLLKILQVKCAVRRYTSKYRVATTTCGSYPCAISCINVELAPLEDGVSPFLQYDYAMRTKDRRWLPLELSPPSR